MIRKIITKCVIDMETLEVIEEEFYYYEGPIVECKGGGGSTSGKVGYPTYMETLHSKWLDSTGVDALSVSMVDAMNAAQGSSPWTTVVAYDPDTDITAWESTLSAFKTLLDGVSDTTDWAALHAQADTSITGVLEADITQTISDYGDSLDSEIETKVLPRFRRGMQDINAVVSSAFPIGEALIESFRDKDVAQYSSKVRLALMDRKEQLLISGTEQMLRLMLSRLGFEESYTKNTVESRRIKIVAKGEQLSSDAKYDETDALWDLSIFQYGANLLGSIGGGTATVPKGPSTAQSAIGGAMAGASAGAMVSGGNPIGAVIGGVLGLASAFM